MASLTVALFNMQVYLMMVAIRSLLYVLLRKPLTTTIKAMFFVQQCMIPLPLPPENFQSSPHAPKCKTIMKSGFEAKSIWQKKESLQIVKYRHLACRSTVSCVSREPLSADGHWADTLNQATVHNRPQEHVCVSYWGKVFKAGWKQIFLFVQTPASG